LCHRIILSIPCAFPFFPTQQFHNLQENRSIQRIISPVTPHAGINVCFLALPVDETLRFGLITCLTYPVNPFKTRCIFSFTDKGMIHCEPDIKVALLQNTEETRIKLEGHFFLSQHGTISGELSARCENGRVVLANPDGEVIRRKEITLFPSDPTKTYFTVKNIQIGIDFHWQRVQEQSFRGGLLLLAHNENHFHLINLVGLEEYLASVISSEMSADAPLERSSLPKCPRMHPWNF